MPNVKCRNCGADAEYIPGESEMCSECGAELKPSELADGLGAVSPLEMSESLAKMAAADRAVEDAAGRVFKTAEPEREAVPGGGDTLGERDKKFAARIDSGEETRRSARNESHLEVEYNRNLFFVNGSLSVIRLRLIPRSDQLRGIMLFMETVGADGEKIRREIPVTETLQTGVALELRLAYRPEKISGRLVFDFYIGCMLATERKFGKFSVEHTVYDPSQSGREVGVSIIQNIRASASEAGDVNVRDSIGKAIGEMRDRNPSVHELIDRLNDLPPQFVRQELRETVWRPETMAVFGTPYPADRLLLEWNGKKILLFGKKRLKLGRSPEECDLLVRAGGGRLGPRDYPNNTVSRVQAEIVYGGDSVKIFDRSSYGTFIGGRRHDSSDLQIPDSAVVEFGDIKWQMDVQHCRMRQTHMICQTCIASRIKAMTFTPVNPESEYYLLVWQCCELGLVIPELSDWTVFFRSNSFFIRTPEQNFSYLRPGGAFSVNGQTIKVNYFPQN